MTAWKVGGITLALAAALWVAKPPSQPEQAPAPPEPATAGATPPTPSAAATDDSLRVAFDGHTEVWSKEVVRNVPRGGGTHDVRELAARLLGDVDVTLSVAGHTEAGERAAVINLAKLGPDDELRIWPEDDGTWAIARNTRQLRAGGSDREEAYRLTDIRELSFRRN